MFCFEETCRKNSIINRNKVNSGNGWFRTYVDSCTIDNRDIILGLK